MSSKQSSAFDSPDPIDGHVYFVRPSDSSTRYEAKQRHVNAGFRRGIHDLLAVRNAIFSLVAGHFSY
jgi:hypothetical protein